MLFHIDTANKELSSIQRRYLKDIGLDERGLQDILFQNLHRVLREEDFVLLMQSKIGQEEPDIMAIDRHGDVYIFEMKAWESQSENLLQVLRYGQIFGTYDYNSLDELFRSRNHAYKKPLLDVLNEHFGIVLSSEDINRNQHFVVLTNGLDFDTRQAIRYWSQRGLSVRGWIYRVYEIDNNPVIEFDTFSKVDDPYEDVEGGYYILNTNYSNDQQTHLEMLNEHKGAAYYAPWKNKIKSIHHRDRVFLYQSGVGIVAAGTAKGSFKMKDYNGQPNEEYYIDLDPFKVLPIPLAAAQMKSLAGRNFVFRQTLFAIDKNTGDKLWSLL